MNSISVGNAIQNLISSMFLNIHTAIPAKIEKYDAKKQMANVQPLINTLKTENISLPYPIIPNVPVMMPKTQNAGLTLPINIGDIVLLIFSERSLDNWLVQGTQGDPTDNRKFDLTDAIAIIGLFPFNIENNNANDELTIEYKKSKIIINNNGQVNINDGNLTVDL